MRHCFYLIALLGVSAAPAPAPHFDPIAFFAGRTEGVGRMKIGLGPTRDVRVQGYGTVLPDGTLVLVQQVVRQDKPPKQREWRIRETSPGNYAGTLSDAGGPITGTSSNGRLHLSFRTRSGFAVDQWLTLAADGRSAANRLTARRMGLKLAHLDETIRKID